MRIIYQVTKDTNGAKTVLVWDAVKHDAVQRTIKYIIKVYMRLAYARVAPEIELDQDQLPEVSERAQCQVLN